MGLEHAKIGVQCLVATRFAGLSLERTDLALHLFDHIADAEQVRFGRFQFAQCLAFLCFVFGDPGGFLKNGAPILRARAQDHVDLALLHH